MSHFFRSSACSAAISPLSERKTSNPFTFARTAAPAPLSPPPSTTIRLFLFILYLVYSVAVVDALFEGGCRRIVRLVPPSFRTAPRGDFASLRSRWAPLFFLSILFLLFSQCSRVGVTLSSTVRGSRRRGLGPRARSGSRFSLQEPDATAT